MPSFRQRDQSDCGVTCLYYVCHHYRLRTSVAYLRQLSGTDSSGTTALGLVETAESLGFSAKGVQCQAQDLQHVALPAIAHVRTLAGLLHYIVLCAVGGKHVTCMDPATGDRRKMPWDEFTARWTGIVIILAPGLSYKPSKGRKRPMSRLLEMLGPQKGVLMQLFTGALVSTVIGLANPIFLQRIMDDVIGNGNRNLLTLLGCAMMGVAVFKLTLALMQGLLSMSAAQKLDAVLITGYYKHLLKLPQAFYNTMRVGEITSRVRDAYNIRDFLNNTILSIFLSPLILVTAYALMFYYSSTVALYSTVLFPIYGLLYLSSDLGNKRFQRVIMEKTAAFDAHLVESLHGISVIKNFGIEDKMMLRSENRLVSMLRTSWEAAKLGIRINSGSGLITQAYGTGLLWVGATQVLDAQLSAGQLMSCVTLSGMMAAQFGVFIKLNRSIRQTLVATERMFEIMDLACEEDNGTSECKITRQSVIRVGKLDFKYPGRDTTLKDINLTFKAGEITVVMGPSGCGKSTIFSLLQRHYQPTHGKITIDGIDINSFTLASYRAAIGIVPQRIETLSGTILENIAPTKEKRDINKITQLCAQTGILEFIGTLPQGFETVLTERGNNLSGGQKQRLATVRALHYECPVLILDEPGSALDAESENKLIEIIKQQRQLGRIIIISAHASKYTSCADQIIKMSMGKVRSVERKDAPGCSSSVESSIERKLPKL
jgi:ATP-binding cassette subfamily B protein